MVQKNNGDLFWDQEIVLAIDIVGQARSIHKLMEYILNI